MRTTTIRPTSDGRYLVFEAGEFLAVLTIDEGVAYLEQSQSVREVAISRGWSLVIEAENESIRRIEAALRDALARRTVAAKRTAA